MKKATLTILGIATLLLSLTLNFRHALNNYGILDNKLHVEVLAQSNSSGGGAGSSSNAWDYVYFEKLTVKHTYGYELLVSGSIEIVRSLPVGGRYTIITQGPYVFSYYDCEGLALARCDQSKIGNTIGSGT